MIIRWFLINLCIIDNWKIFLRINSSLKMSMKPFKTILRISEENNPLNPHINRVFYKKYLNEVNDALQSVIVAGKLKRM